MKQKNSKICKLSTCRTLLPVVTFALLTAFLPISGIAKAAKQEHQSGNVASPLPIRAIVRPSAKARISTELAARAINVVYQEGEAFRQGDLLIEFDCQKQKALLASSRALQREATILLKTAKFLKKRNAGSGHDFEIAIARFEKAKADTDIIRSQINECTIHAPYDGRIAELGIQEHEISSASKPVISIVALNNPRIELVVPSLWLAWLKHGTPFQFLVDETGKYYTGRVVRLGATIATVSQTIKVFAVFEDMPQDILPGMSGTVKFPQFGG